MNNDPDDIHPNIMEEYQRAYALVGRGDYANAVPILQRCVQARPDFVTAQKELAHSLTKLGKLEEALPHRLKILELEPHNLNYRLAMINQFTDLKRYADALSLAEVLQKLAPKNAEFQALVKRLNTLANVGGIFVSYRSHDSDAARSLTELLLNNDFDVWFAEYRVLSFNYDKFNEDLENELKGALARCKTAVVVTNDEWAASPYCQSEIHFISEHYAKERIFQICVPSKHSRPLEEWPILREVETIVCDFANRDSVATVEDWLLDKLGVADENRRRLDLTGDMSEVVTIQDTYRGGNLATIRPGPFERTTVPFWMQFFSLGDIQGMLEGSPNLSFRHRKHRGLNLVIDARPTRWIDAPSDSTKDDRAIYRDLRSVVRNGVSTLPSSEEKGLHLFHWEGKGHLAITFRTPVIFGIYCWKRIYVIRVRNEVDDSIGEVTLDFTSCFKGNKPDPQAFRTFCTFLPLCDEVARSLGYQGYRSRQLLIRVRVAWALLGVLLALLVIVPLHIFATTLSPLVWIAGVSAGGILGLLVNQQIMVNGRLRRTADIANE